MKYTLGISPCPNDVWAFAGLLSGAIRVPGIELAIELHDVQELNSALANGRYDFAKTSFLAALQLSSELVMLRSGSALGFGVGPILVGRAQPTRATKPHVLLPGPNTTAHLLFRLYGPSEATVEHVIFSDILPRLSAGSADMGVCIHEGRFVYQSLGLDLVLDLGARWEADTQAPLPLGGIAARRNVPAASMAAVDEAIRASLAWAQAHESEALELCRRHAQELDEHVLRAHIELYVNAHTTDLGTVGVHALNVLSERARAVGLVAAQTPPLLVRATLAPC